MTNWGQKTIDALKKATLPVGYKTASRFNYTQGAVEGVRYSDNLSGKDIANLMRNELKEVFPDCKFSITRQSYSGGQSITVALMSAPFEVFNKTYTKDKNGNVYTEKDYGYAQLNEYTTREATENYANKDGYNNGSYLTDKAREVLKYAVKLSDSYNFDDSDGQIDYFHTNFYLHLQIGRWDKDFKVIS